MKSATKQLLVVVTAPSLTVARKLAKSALEARLVACANLIPRLESLYWWEGKLEKATEVLLLMKTTQARVDHLERLILKLHPYDTPEFVALPVEAATKRYLDWWTKEVS